jgi:hypothetical protein
MEDHPRHHESDDREAYFAGQWTDSRAEAEALVELEKGVEVDAWQSVALWHACRAAKETLLGAEGPKKHPVAVLGRGSRLIGGTISVELDRAEITSALVDGFFPHCQVEEKPATRRVSGFREIGLPFETDTAITRHLAAFLTAHGQGKQAVRPTHVLFNGGVFKAEALRRRLLEVLEEWFPKGEPPQVLEGNLDLDFAVARGAAYYGSVKQGQGVRIRGGTARSYYVGIETAGLAIPGAPTASLPLRGAWHGGRNGSQGSQRGNRIGGGRTGAIPVFQLGCSQTRQTR